MTEVEWLVCTKPLTMCGVIAGKCSDRKLRLFACACARKVLPLLGGDLLSTAIQVLRSGEDLADGLVTPEKASILRETFRSIPGDFQWAAVAVSTVLAMPEDFGEEDARLVAGHTSFAATAAAGLLNTFSDGWEKEIQNPDQCDLLRDILGPLSFRPVNLNATWLTWNDSTVVKVAHSIYEDRAFDQLPGLADALEEAGCTDPDILNHCRQPGEHVCGCWVLDLLLDKR